MAKGKKLDRKPTVAIEDPILSKPNSHTANARSSRWLMIAGAAGVIFFFGIYATRLDKVVGMFQDDAWYALLGKALATGQGYTLINSPSPGILPLYPPAFPFLLSIFYRLSPSFPDNIWLLKSLSVAAMLGMGVLTYRYLIRTRSLEPRLALSIAFAAV